MTGRFRMYERIFREAAVAVNKFQQGWVEFGYESREQVYLMRLFP